MRNKSILWLITTLLTLLFAVFAPGWVLSARENAAIGRVKRGEMPDYTARVESTMGKLLLIADQYAQRTDYGAVDNTVAIALRDILDQQMEELNELGAFTKKEYDFYKDIVRDGKRRGNAYFSAHQYSVYGGSVGGMLEYYVLSLPENRFSVYMDVETGKVLRLIWGKQGINLGYNLRVFLDEEDDSFLSASHKKKMLRAWATYYGVEFQWISPVLTDGEDYRRIAREVQDWMEGDWDKEAVLRVAPIGEMLISDGNIEAALVGAQYHLKGGEDGFLWTPVILRDVTPKPGE